MAPVSQLVWGGGVCQHCLSFLLRVPDRQQQGSEFRDAVNIEGKESQVDDYYTVLLLKVALKIGLLCFIDFTVLAVENLP